MIFIHSGIYKIYEQLILLSIREIFLLAVQNKISYIHIW